MLRSRGDADLEQNKQNIPHGSYSIAENSRSPSYANIFMGKLEKELLAQSRKKPTVWWRYIDDVFALGTHGEESLNNFIGDINQAHPTIKFTAEWSKESLS